MEPNRNKLILSTTILTATIVCVLAPPVVAETPVSLTTPDKVETSIGTLEYKDGAPSADTISKVYDALAFTRGVDAFLNSYGGGVRLSDPQGFHQHRSRRQ